MLASDPNPNPTNVGGGLCSPSALITFLFIFDIIWQNVGTATTLQKQSNLFFICKHFFGVTYKTLDYCDAPIRL